ncbi:transcription factor ATOH8 [Pelecanus crispus]|uniref:transcription factor ATOH8 n=1 Tax=Pelecanus crispus TaxID=36300 RepID=UPI003F5D350B
MRSTPLAEGEHWPRLCAAELGGLRRLRRKPGCKSFRVELKVLSGRRTGLRAPPPPPPPPAAPPPAWEPRSAFPAAASAFPAAPPPPPPAARPPPPPPAASPRPRPGEASGVSPEIKALQQTRRLLANARERTRVHTISAAFEALRKQVPCYSYGQKLSKLAILRIACNYILSLARLADLDYSADHSNMSFSECVEQCTRTLQAEGRSKKRKDLQARAGSQPVCFPTAAGSAGPGEELDHRRAATRSEPSVCPRDSGTAASPGKGGLDLPGHELPLPPASRRITHLGNRPA